MRKILAVLLVALALGLFTSRMRSQQTTRPEDAQVLQRLGIVRSLDTEEVNYQATHARFADRDEIVAFLRERGSRKLVGEIEHPEPYELAIITNRDGSHYHLSFVRRYVESDESSRCPTSIFSDDSGVIFLGLGLGCSDDEKALASLKESLSY